MIRCPPDGRNASLFQGSAAAGAKMSIMPVFCFLSAYSAAPGRQMYRICAGYFFIIIIYYHPGKTVRRYNDTV